MKFFLLLLFISFSLLQCAKKEESLNFRRLPSVTTGEEHLVEQ